MAILDEAAERVAELERSRFEAAVEAARIGTAAAWNKRAASSWRSRRQRRPGPRTGGTSGLTDAALEKAVAQIMARDPGLVRVDRV